jgi:hypothetical protein
MLRDSMSHTLKAAIPSGTKVFQVVLVEILIVVDF